MSDIEERLARLRPRPAPEEILRRAQGGAAVRRTFGWKEIPMTIAASALMALLVTVMWPQDPAKDKPAPAAVLQDEWLDREVVADDLLAVEARRLGTLVQQLGADEQDSREKAQKELTAILEFAIPFVRAAVKSEDAEVRSRATQLVALFEKRPKLGPAVAQARRESKLAGDERKRAEELAEQLFANVTPSSPPSVELLKIGWPAVPVVADAAAKRPFARAIEVRPLVRVLCDRFFEKRTRVVMDIRPDNDAYGTSAYSFLFASQEVDDHKNMVDLVYNGCGTLHFNPYGGAKNRIASLGEVDYGGVREVPEKGWLKDCVRPKAGHVYVFEGALATSVARKTFAVKFVVVEVAADRVTIEWTPLGEMPKAPRMPGMGRAGTMGQCGGAHGER